MRRQQLKGQAPSFQSRLALFECQSPHSADVADTHAHQASGLLGSGLLEGQLAFGYERPDDGAFELAPTAQPVSERAPVRTAALTLSNILTSPPGWSAGSPWWKALRPFLSAAILDKAPLVAGSVVASEAVRLSGLS